MSLNKVILIGNVGKDPEVRYFDAGVGIANFPLATSERGYTLANGTVVPERTEWHNVVVRREQVAFVEKWVKKGSLMYVEGKIRTRHYEDQSGTRRYVTEIHADKVEFFSLGSRQQEQGAKPATSQQPTVNDLAAQAQKPEASKPITPFEDEGVDDLPF